MFRHLKKEAETKVYAASLENEEAAAPLPLLGR